VTTQTIPKNWIITIVIMQKKDPPRSGQPSAHQKIDTTVSTKWFPMIRIIHKLKFRSELEVNSHSQRRPHYTNCT
jgi:hypothetical protein